jgi:hypothetical protein
MITLSSVTLKTQVCAYPDLWHATTRFVGGVLGFAGELGELVASLLEVRELVIAGATGA